MDWESLFRSSSKSMRGKFEEARVAIEHRGVKGNLNEQIVAEFLRNVLPPKVGFCAGEVIDSDGNRSRQVDVLAYDAGGGAPVFQHGDVRVLPVEAVYGAIEVKTFLNKHEIEAAFQNMVAIKSLTKKAYFPNLAEPRSRLYGMAGTHWPVTFFIFAFESDSLDTVLQHIEGLNANQPIHQRIDMVFVLDKGLVVNVSPAGLDAIPMPGNHLIAKPTANALLAFYAVLNTLFAQTYSEPININEYLRHIKF